MNKIVTKIFKVSLGLSLFVTNFGINLHTQANEINEIILAKNKTLEEEFGSDSILLYQYYFTKDKYLNEQEFSKSTEFNINFKNNEMNIYSAIENQPFAPPDCGGFPCWFSKQKGLSVGQLVFSNQNGVYIVTNASGKALFLKGAKCIIEFDDSGCYSKKLICESSQFPVGYKVEGERGNEPAIFIFEDLSC